MLLAVAATLGLDDEAIHEPLPTNILEGLIPTLPLVQHLPEEHFIHVQAGYGTWAIVVWAHHILGLNVLVKSSRHSNSIIQRSDAKSTGIISETCFGSSHPRNVIVDLGSRRLQPEITLQSNTGNGPTFHLKPEPEMENIIANQKRHLQGYGKRILNKTISYHLARERVIDELSLVACAFAVCASRKLCAGGIVRGASDHWIALETASEESFTPSYRATAESPKPAQDLLECDLLEIPTPRIIEATRVLFDDHHRIKPETIKDYILLYSSRPLATIPEPPESIAVHIRSWKRDDMWNQNPTSWGKMSSAACGLCVVLLALANVVDIDKAAQLPIREYIHEVRRSTLHQLLLEWDGTSLIPVNERVWFEIISLLMLGQSAAEDEACCLVSDFGWSLYVHTVREEDPSHVLGGNPVVQPGVPWRNSIWKHSVRDGPLGSPSDHSVWRKTAEFGQEAGTVSRACNVERGKTFVGERKLPVDPPQFLLGTLTLLLERDSFVVSVHLHTTDSGTSGHTVTLRTGYGELSSALLGARTTESCAHKTTRRDKVKLPPGWSMLEGFGGHDNPKSLTRYKLCPTAANSLARWRALLSILENDDRDERQRTMLRKPDCCLRCAIDQTSSMDGAWFLVL